MTRLREAMRRTRPRWEFSELAKEVSIKYPRFYRLVQGLAPVTREEASRIAELLGKRVEELFEERTYVRAMKIECGYFARKAEGEQ